MSTSWTRTEDLTMKSIKLQELDCYANRSPHATIVSKFPALNSLIRVHGNNGN